MTIKSASVLCSLDNKIQSKIIRCKDKDYRIDVVKPCYILSFEITRKAMNFMYRCGITENLIRRKNSGLGLVVEHYYSVKQLLTAHSVYII